MTRSSWAGAVMALALAAPAGADPALEPVIVTATRTALPIDEVLAPVELITRGELERAVAADAADLLRFHAGLEIARNGGPGQTTSLFIRGSESNHSLVLVDGVRINPGTIGVAALQNLSPAMIERIEVVKGPRSTLYGSDAIGGVVNVITRKGADAGLRAQFGAGGYGTRTASLSAGTGGSRGDVSFIGSWLDSSGFPTRTGDTVDRGYRNVSLNLSGRTTLGGVELGARAWHSAGTSEYSDFFLTPVDQDYEDSTVAADAAFEVRPGWRSRVSIARALDDIQQNQADEFSGDQDFLRTRRWSLDWQNDLAAGEHHALTFGALLQHEDAATLSYGSGFDEATAINLFYLQDRVEYGRHRAMLAVGYTDHDTFGSQVTWNGEYGLALGESRSAYVAAGTAFRAPDASDRYGYGGNPALRPESSRNVEVGLRQRIGQAQQLTLSAFRNDLTNLIEFTFTDPETYAGENRNVARARIDGVEAGWSFSGDLWQARASFNWQDPRDLSSDTLLLRRAQRNATLFVARRLGPHEVSLDLLAAGARYDYGYPDPVRLGGYVVANLAATLAAGTRWHVIARLENALDADYELARGYNTMGRTLFVAARYDFR